MNKGTWRHCNPACTLDLRILNVLDRDSKRIIVEVCYINKKTGAVQYTGEGIGEITDIARILIKDFINWKELK